MDAFYEKQEPTELRLPDREALVHRLLEHKFKPAEDGGYRRKKFSFLKDTINYHVRITEDTSIANALRREVDHFERARILAIAVDSTNNTGYFMDIKKRNISFYSYGCRMIKELYGDSTMW